MNITYNNEKYVIPSPFDTCFFGDDPIRKMNAVNPYTEEACMLPTFAFAIYEAILSANMTHDDDLRDAGIDWFEKNFNTEYLALLD